MKKLFAEINKTEELDDGTLKVWGYASTANVDSDGETITSDAMKNALPDYMKFGAVREMHQPSAAGTAIEASVDSDGRTFFGAHVVDPVAVKKVQSGVYKGFSIGGKVTKRDDLNKTIITGLRLVEVSLVDRPANPDAVFTCYKAEMPDDDAQPVAAIDEIADLLNKGAITAEKLLELAKAEHVGTQEQKEEDLPAEESTAEVSKGLSGVARFAELMTSVKYLSDDVQWEAEYEGDNSELPAKIKEWMASGLALLAEMLQEEAAEATASDADKADAPTDIQKSYEVKSDDLAKALGAIETLSSQLEKALSSNNDLAKRVEQLEAKPAPGKALLFAVNKNGGVDSVGGDQSNVPEPVMKNDGSVDEVASIIKAVHASGGVVAKL